MLDCQEFIRLKESALKVVRKIEITETIGRSNKNNVLFH